MGRETANVNGNTQVTYGCGTTSAKDECTTTEVDGTSVETCYCSSNLCNGVAAGKPTRHA